MATIKPRHLARQHPFKILRKKTLYVNVTFYAFERVQRRCGELYPSLRLEPCGDKPGLACCIWTNKPILYVPIHGRRVTSTTVFPSFGWAADQWMAVQQTVSLNIAGIQDGSLTLKVNGKKAMDRNDVYYREDPSSQSKNERISRKSRSTPTPTRTKPTSTSNLKPISTLAAKVDGGILGPILGGLLDGLGLRDQVVDGQEVMAQQWSWGHR